MVRMGNAGTIVVTVATMAVTTTGVLGQEGAAMLAPTAPGPEVERLETKASSFMQERRSWAQAASLLHKAAEARGSLDPMAAEDLRAAGYLYFYAGNAEAALEAIRKTGWLFFRQGDFDRAAAAMLEGAWIAEKSGLSEQARELADWGTLLQRPSLVQPAQYQPEA